LPRFSPLPSLVFFTGVNDTNSSRDCGLNEPGQQGYDGIVYAPDVLPLPATVVVQSVILLLLFPDHTTITVTAFLQQMFQIAGEKIEK
jgi:hypothetical protein